MALFILIALAVVVASATESEAVRIGAFVAVLIAVLIIGANNSAGEHELQIMARSVRDIRRELATPVDRSGASGPFVVRGLVARRRIARAGRILRVAVPLIAVLAILVVEYGRHFIE